MNKNKGGILSVVAAAGLLIGMLTSAQGSDYLVTPTTTPNWTGTDNSNLNPSEIATLVGYFGTLSEAYIMNAGTGGTEGGTYADSYHTTFSPPSDPSGAQIIYDGSPDPYISAGQIYLYVKDGNQNPAYYIFDISTWNGTDTIDVQGFWLQNGAISHVTILTGPRIAVPDGGSVLTMLGMAMVLIEGFRRRVANRS